MSMAIGAKLQLEPGSWAELIYDVSIGAAVGAYHSFYIVTKWWYDHLIRPILRTYGFAKRSSNQYEEEKSSLKVVAVGYGRTGTVSGIRSVAGPILFV
jgi:hypothetical protein